MPYALGSANRNFATATDTRLRRRVRRGRQVRRDDEPEPRPDLQHRLRAGRSRRAADQPHALQRALSGKAAVLPREPRPLRRRARTAKWICSSAGPSASTRAASCVPIKGGGRLTGKASGVNIGLLNMQTDAATARCSRRRRTISPPCGSARTCANRTTFGGIFVNRAATGDLAGDGDWNRTWGMDGRLGIGEAITFQGFAARTETPGALESEHAFSGGGEYRDAAVQDRLQLHGGRRGLQSRGRVPRAVDGVPAGVDGLPLQPEDERSDERGLPRTATARDLRELLGLRRLQGNRHRAHGRAHGLGERQLLQPGGQPAVRRPGRAVRGLPGRRRAPGTVRRVPHGVCRATPIAERPSPFPGTGTTESFSRATRT